MPALEALIPVGLGSGFPEVCMALVTACMHERNAQQQECMHDI